MGAKAHFGYFSTFGPRSAARRPLGPLVSGQSQLRVPLGRWQGQIAIFDFRLPLWYRYITENSRFLGGVCPIYTYIYISDLFDPISAARRPFGPLVSGQMWERVPFWGQKGQIAILDVFSAILGPLCKIFKLDKWSFLLIFTGFGCFGPLSADRPLEGRLGHQSRVRCGKGCHFGGRRVKLRFWTFLAPFWGHCAKISNSKKWSFLLVFAGFDCFSKKNSE